MPRTAEFDPGQALVAASELFHARGYEPTSIGDLVEHLGVARAGIYREFGSKHELFVRALRHYRAERDAAAVAVLEQPGSGLSNVRALLTEYAGQARSDPRGCLVVNTAAELGESDPEVSEQLRESWATLRQALHAALRRAVADGELPPGSDAEGLAALLVSMLQGLRVVGRGGAPELAEVAVSQLLALLGGAAT